MTAGYRLKLDRALLHANCLKQEVEAWTELHVDAAFEKQYDSKTKRVVVTFIGTADPPESWGLLIGDCLHNLRSALDNLAFALALRFSRRLTVEEQAWSEFPIFGPRAMTPTEETHRIGRIDPQAQAVIKRLQPHLRGHAFARDPLWQLHEFSVTDKHRLLLTTIGTHAATAILQGSFGPGTIRGGSRKPGTVVVDVLDLGTTSPMDMSIGVALGVEFAAGPRQGANPIGVLTDLHQYLTDRVVAPLERFL